MLVQGSRQLVTPLEAHSSSPASSSLLAKVSSGLPELLSYLRGKHLQIQIDPSCVADVQCGRYFLNEHL